MCQALQSLQHHSQRPMVHLRSLNSYVCGILETAALETQEGELTADLIYVSRLDCAACFLLG